MLGLAMRGLLQDTTINFLGTRFSLTFCLTHLALETPKYTGCGERVLRDHFYRNFRTTSSVPTSE